MKRRGRKPGSALTEPRADYRQRENVTLSPNVHPASIGGFIELSVKGKDQPKLEKASLVFSDFSLSVEGNLKSSQIIEILKVLDGSVC